MSPIRYQRTARHCCHGVCIDRNGLRLPQELRLLFKDAEDLDVPLCAALPPGEYSVLSKGPLQGRAQGVEGAEGDEREGEDKLRMFREDLTQSVAYTRPRLVARYGSEKITEGGAAEEEMSKVEKKEAHRVRVMWEIVATEESYLKMILAMQRLYADPLLTNKDGKHKLKGVMSPQHAKVPQRARTA